MMEANNTIDNYDQQGMPVEAPVEAPVEITSESSRGILANYKGYHCILYKDVSYYIYCGVGEKPSGISQTHSSIYMPKFDNDERFARFLGFKNSGGISLSSALEGIISRSTPQYAEEYLSKRAAPLSLSNGTLTMSCPNGAGVFNVHSGMMPPIQMEVFANLLNKKDGNKYDAITLNCSRTEFERYYNQYFLIQANPCRNFNPNDTHNRNRNPLPSYMRPGRA